MTPVTRQSNMILEGSQSTWLHKPHWLGILALLGAILLVGGSLSWAATTNSGGMDDKLLPKILQQLEEQGKKVKSSAVVNIGDESEVLVMLMDGGIKRYDSQGRVKYEKDAKGKETIYENGMPVEERDARGNILSKTTYERVAGQVRRSVKVSRTGTETKIFDAKGNIIQLTNQNGTKTYSNYVKDANGKVRSYTENDMNTGKVSQLILDPKTGEVTSKIDQNGVQTDIENFKDETGQLVKSVEKDSAGNVTVKRYEQGQLVEENKNGIRTVFENVPSEKGGLAQVTEKKYIPSNGGMNVETTVKTFDAAGRVAKQVDKDGEHTYTYVLSPDGRMVGRREFLKGKDGKVKDIYNQYDEAGRVIASSENGKDTKTTYVLDEKGNIQAAIETVTHNIGGKQYTETIRKEYDSQNHEIARTDTFGNRTEYTYDAHGNRIKSQSDFETTKYTYDSSNNMTASVTEDNKSTTFTEYDTKTKLAKHKVKVMNSGAVNVTEYGLNSEGKRTSYEYTAFGIKVTTYRSATSDQPETMTYYKYNGKIITTTYQYEGDYMVSSKETGPTGETVTTYNSLQKPQHAERIDQFGKKSVTDYDYKNGKMSSSLMADTKGRTVTEFNKYEEPIRITRENTIGFPRRSVEERFYDQGMLKSSVSSDFRGKSYTSYDENEQATTVHRVNYHGWPRENWVKNIYDKGGDVVETVQTDKRGYTHNYMDADGLQTKSVRYDFHGFPKEKTTTYQYVKGEMVSSVTTDERGRTFNKFDKDGLMRSSERKKLFGYPRLEKTTYDYDQNGFMTYSKEADENGTSESWYNIDEVVDVSKRVNTYGHAKVQWTKFEYDGEGFMTVSKETDLRGVTISHYDIDGLAVSSMRYDKYGVLFGRETLTRNEYDENGFLTVSHSKNLMGTTDKIVDRDGLTRKVVQDDNFGLNWSRHKVTDGYEYDDHGRMTKSVERDLLGTTISKYDINGDATWSERFANTGLNYSRDTVTESKFDEDTGITTYSISKNTYGTTQNLDYDPITGLSETQISDTNYGVGGGRHTVTKNVADIRHGLMRETFGENALGKTHTVYDTVTGGRHGVSSWSRQENNYGLGYTRVNETKFTVNCDNGLTSATHVISKGANGRIFSESWNTMDDKEYGTTLSTYTRNSYGIGATRESRVKYKDDDIDKNTGLTRHMISTTAYGTTETFNANYYDSNDTYGLAKYSITTNNYGVGNSRVSTINYKAGDVDAYTGLTKHTISDSKAATTETWNTNYFDPNDTFGVAKKSVTNAKSGIGAARHSEIDYKDGDVDTNTGLTRHSISVSAQAKVETWNDNAVDPDDTYGLAHKTVTDANFGIGAARHSEVNYANGDIDKYCGLTWHSISVSAQARVETWNNHDTYGLASKSVTDSNFGIGASRHSVVNYAENDIDKATGLTRHSISISAQARVETWNSNDSYGLAQRTVTDANFGIGAARHSEVNYAEGDIDKYSGLTWHSISISKQAKVETWNNHDTYGLASKTVTDANFGIGAARHSEVKYVAGDIDQFSGLTLHSISISKQAKVETWNNHDTYGLASKTVTDSNFGIGAARHSEVNYVESDIDKWSGLTWHSISVSKQAKVETWNNHDTYGLANKTVTDANFGIGAARHSVVKYTDDDIDKFSGLTLHSISISAQAKVETWNNHDTYGLAHKTVTDANFGIGAARHSEVNYADDDIDKYSGLTWHSISVSAQAKVETWNNHDSYGLASKTVTDANFGIGAARHSEVNYVAGDIDKYSGLTMHSVSISAQAKVETWNNNDSYGLAHKTVTDANFGIGAARHSVVDYAQDDIDQWSGLTWHSISVSAQAKTETFNNHDTYGLANKTITDSNFGIGAARHSEVNYAESDIDKYSGLTWHSISISKQAKVETWNNHDTYGLAHKTVTDANFGIGASRHSVVNYANDDIDKYSGLTLHSISISAQAKTETWNNNDSYGLAKKSVTDSNFGIGAARHSETNYVDGDIDKYSGMTWHSVAVSKQARVETWNNHDSYGLAQKSVTDSYFGIGAARHSETNYVEGDIDKWSGLTWHSISISKQAKVETWNNHDDYGLANRSVTDADFGIGAARHSEVNYVSSDIDKWSGLTWHSISVSAQAKTETWNNHDSYGLAKKSVTNSNFGIGAARHSETNYAEDDIDKFSGLTLHSISVSAQAKVETWNNDDSYGLAKKSVTDSNFGIGAARHSETNYEEGDIDKYSGLTWHSIATSAQATTETWNNHDSYGLASKSVTDSNFGIGAARHTVTNYVDGDIDKYSGMTWHSVAVSAQSRVETWNAHDSYGLAVKSVTNGNFGIGAARHSETNYAEGDIDKYSGMTWHSIAISAQSRVETWNAHDSYGLAVKSVTNSNFGIGAARHSVVNYASDDIDKYSGMTWHNISESAQAKTETWNSHDSYGLAEKCVTDSKFGIGAARHSVMKYASGDIDKYSGMTWHSISESAQAKTETWNNHDSYGLAYKSVTDSKFGIGAARHNVTSYSDGDIDKYSGMTWHSVSESAQARVESWNNHDSYGLQSRSVSDSKFGIGAARHSETNYAEGDIDKYSGQTWHTISISAQAKTETWNNHDSYGLANRSVTDGNFGVYDGRHSETVYAASDLDQWSGLTKHSKTESGVATTETWNDITDSYGLAKKVISKNKYGLIYARQSTINYASGDIDKYSGTTWHSISKSEYSKNETWNNHDSYGLANRSETTSYYGIGAARFSWIDYGDGDVNHWTGQNYQTTSHSDQATTTTQYDSWDTGTAESSDTVSTRGLLGSRHSWVSKGNMLVNKATGQNIYQRSENALMTSDSWFDQTYGTTIATETWNTYGLISSQHSWIPQGKYITSPYTGLSQKTTSYSENGWTETKYENEDSYGLMESATTHANFGAPAGLVSTTKYKVDRYWGMNTYSRTDTDMGYSENYYELEYGTAYKTFAHNDLGAKWARDTTTYPIQVNYFTGLNIKTTAVNKLGTTVTDQFNQVYGTAEHSYTDNTYGTDWSKHSDTTIDADHYTGQNRETYTRTKLSDSWTYYNNQTGAQTWSYVVAQEFYTLGYAINTINIFECYNTNTMRKSTAFNLMGTTETNYDTNGLATSSKNWSAYGLAYYTYTTTYTNQNTGMMDHNVAVAYSRQGGQKLSTTTSYANIDGVVTSNTTVSTYGATDGRTTYTTITDYDHRTGNKLASSSHNYLGSSTTKYDVKGCEVSSTSDSEIGPTWGRHTESSTVSMDSNTGIKTGSYSTSSASSSYNYFDANGLPDNAGYCTVANNLWSGKVYGEKTSYYGGADGDKYELSFVTGDIYWSGNPSQILTVTDISTNLTDQNANGFATKTVSTKKYAQNGSQKTTTYNTPDTVTGLTKYSTTYRCNDKGWSSQTFDVAHGGKLGVLDESYDHSKDKDGEWHTTHTEQWNYSTTGLMKRSVSTGDNNYRCESWADDQTRGWANRSHTQQDVPWGKDKKTQSYDATTEYNPWTGLKSYEHRYNWQYKQDSDRDDIYYDIHGVEDKTISTKPDYPQGQIYQVKTFTKTSEGNITGWVNTYGDVRETVLELVTDNRNGKTGSYFAKHTYIENLKSMYLPWQDIVYTLGTNGPTAADVTDSHGTEHWTMNETYNQSGIKTRDRTTSGGTHIKWTYTDFVSGAYFHQKANITYTNYMGIANGSGSETYTSAGILTKQTLTNSNVWNETITYSNDGTYITKGVSTRQDGQKVVYRFSGANDLVSSEDDKGTTTWDAYTNHRTGTSGNMGYFTYVYSGDQITQINGTSSVDGTMVYDKYWNLKQWTDTKGVVHTYTKTSGNSTKSNYWTEAKETFTDKYGTSWTGQVKYDTYGFYFAGETLKATNAKLDGEGAKNTFLMDTGKMVVELRKMLQKHQTTKDTWTWKSSKDTHGNKTNGQLKSELLSVDDITKYADVEITIAANGSYTAKLSNVKFNETNLVKTNRYKPKCTKHTYTVRGSKPAEYDNRDMGIYDNAYTSAHIGYRQYVTSGPTQVKVGSHKVQTGTDSKGNAIYTTVDDYANEYTYVSEDWSKDSDGYEWTASGSKTQNSYSDKVTQAGNNIVASPVKDKTKANTVSSASVTTATQTVANKSQGVILGYVSSGATTAVKVNVSGGKTVTKSTTTATETGEVSASAVVTAASTSKTKTTTGQTSTSGKEKSQTTVTKDELVAKFAAIKSLQDIAEFIKLVAAKLGIQGIADGLENSSAANLMKALVNAYKLFFGEGYQNSLLGKLISLATSNDAVVEEVRVAIEGGEAVPNEVKLAAKIAREVKDAKKVTKDEEGRVVEAVDKNGAAHKYEYDESGLTETVTGLDGKTAVRHFDNAGQLLSETTDGKSRTYAYEMSGQSITKVTVTERTEDGVATLVYDNQGRLTSAEKNGQKNVITYESSESYTAKLFAASGDLQEERTYKQGRLAQVKRADGSTVTNEYMTDGSGKVLAMTQTIEDKDGKKTLLKYNAEGRLISALGKDADRIQKTAEEGNISEQAFGFEVGKELFGDPRMDGMRLDQKKLQMGFGNAQGGGAQQ